MLNKGTTGTILYRLWYDAVLDWGLNPGPPALDANTLPLVYRGGGVVHSDIFTIQQDLFVCTLHMHASS